MSIKKKLLAVAAVSALTVATAVPAMALENEFHGMYKFMGYETNFFNGVNGNLNKDAHSGFMAEQRARINYIAKANDNLKLVTHFELDSRFGGKSGGYLGTTGNDGGNLDADQLTLETKSIYLDFNCPITGTNVKAGLQPWADAYKSVFLLADMTGAIATKKFDPLTVSLGWFRFDDDTLGFGTTDTTSPNPTPGKLTADLIVVDGKFAVSKDITVGASYYNVQRDTTVGGVAGTIRINDVELLHMVGANAAMKFGPAAVDVFGAYQFGEVNANDDLSAFMGGATAKVKVGPGNINAAALYLSGDGSALTAAGDRNDFKNIAANTSYFNPANMWLLVRSGQAVNSSTSVLSNDLTVGGRGLIGFFAGYEGTVDKIFYNANVGYAMTAEEGTNENGSLGTEINAQVGYKLYDNLSLSIAAAGAFLKNGLSAKVRAPKIGAPDADDVYMTNVQLSYVF